MPAWITTVGQWLWLNVVGNEVATVLAVVGAGLWAHVKVIRPLHRRLDHQDAKLHQINQATGGDHASDTSTTDV